MKIHKANKGNDKSPTIILDKKNGASYQGSTYTNFILTEDDIVYNNEDIYEVLGAGKIKIKKTGNYLFSAEMVTSSMPAGNYKYVIGFFVNGNGKGFLGRGSIYMSKQDYWGATGSLMYPIQAGSIIDIKYFIATPITSLHANIGITKI